MMKKYILLHVDAQLKKCIAILKNFVLIFLRLTIEGIFSIFNRQSKIGNPNWLNHDKKQ